MIFDVNTSINITINYLNKIVEYFNLRMDRFEKYVLCKFCKEVSEIKMYHRNLKFLMYLLEELGPEIYSPNLFGIIKHHLLLVCKKYGALRGSQQNKIVSKYYIYFLKHRQFINFSECMLIYSPLKKEVVAVEFQQHLDALKKNICLS